MGLDVVRAQHNKRPAADAYGQFAQARHQIVELERWRIVEKGEEKIFRGIVGEIIAYVHRIPLFIDGKELEVRVAFALAEVPNLLGRLDIFRNFEINFRKEEDFCFSD